jgi:hypothetical protein
MFFSHFFGSSTDSLQISLDFHPTPGGFRHGPVPLAPWARKLRRRGHGAWTSVWPQPVERDGGRELAWVATGTGQHGEDHLLPIVHRLLYTVY